MAKFKVLTTCEIEVEAENHQKALIEAKKTNFDYWAVKLEACHVAKIEENDEIDKNGYICHICQKDHVQGNGCAGFFEYSEEEAKWAIYCGYNSRYDMDYFDVLGEIGGEPYVGKIICDACIDSAIVNGKITKVPNEDYGSFDDYDTYDGAPQ